MTTSELLTNIIDSKNNIKTSLSDKGYIQKGLNCKLNILSDICTSVYDVDFIEKILLSNNKTYIKRLNSSIVEEYDIQGEFNSSSIPNSDTIEHLILGHAVTSLALYGDLYNLKSIYIPSSITSIPDYAFEYTETLEDIIIENIVSIGAQAFYECINIKNISILSVENLNSVNTNAFYGVSAHTIRIPEFPNELGKSVFPNSNTIKTLVIPNNISVFKDGGFNLLDGVETVSMPNNISSISDGAFTNMKKLENINIPSSVINIGIGSFASTNLKSIEIPSSVRIIENEAFSYCQNLSSVVLNNGISVIGSEAFRNCISLKNINIPGSIKEFNSTTVNPPGLVFWNCYNLEYVKFNYGNTYTGDYNFCDCNSLKYIDLPNSISAISDGTFQNCISLTEIILPSSVEYIGNGPFYGCTNLSSIIFNGPPPLSVYNPPYGPSIGLPATTIGYYLTENAAAWEAVIVDGKWNGITMQQLNTEN